MFVTLDSVVSLIVWVCGAQCLSCWTMLFHLLSGCVEHNVCNVGQCCFTYCLGVWSTMSVTLDSVVSLTVWVCGVRCLSCWTVLFHLLSGCVEHNVCHVG